MPSVRLIALGGTDAIGKNMTLLECEGQIVVIDAGLMFPGPDEPGVDIIIPDMSYLVERREQLLGVVLTHGHEDHMGAVPFLLDEVQTPIFSTRLTLGILRSKLAEFHDLEQLDAREVNIDERLELGPFTFEFVRVNHSIPEPTGLGIHTPAGLIVHSGDFKFDPTPLYGPSADIHKFAEFGRLGTRLLLCDCTNAERPGYTPSERVVREAFEELFETRKGRLIVASFASNLGRIQQVLDVAAETERKVAVTGRSMNRLMDVGLELGVLQEPEGVLTPIEDIDDYPDEDLVVLTTGTQGEPLSALSLMAQGQHRHVEVRPGDTVVFSASPIPGNEGTILRTVDQLLRRGAEVIHGRETGVHVSGHGSQEELKLLLTLVQPECTVPVHGEYRHMVRYRELAASMGMPLANVFLLDPGDVLELDERGVRRGESVPAGSVNVDGLGVGDVGEVVLRDRQQMAEGGIIMPVLVIDAETFEPAAPPDVYSRGLVYVEEATELMEALKAEIAAVAESFLAEEEKDAELLRRRLRSQVRRAVQQLTERRPIVLPIVIELGKAPETAEDEDTLNWAPSAEGERP